MADQVSDTAAIDTPPRWVCVVCEGPIDIVDRVPATPKSKEAHFGYCPNCGRPEYAERPESRVPTNNHEVLEAIDEVIHRPHVGSHERILEIVEIVRNYDDLTARRGGVKYIPRLLDEVYDEPYRGCGMERPYHEPDCPAELNDARVGSIDDRDPMMVER